MGKKVYISIATYNESDNIEKLIREIFSLAIDDLFIVVIDDNSPDGTSQIVEKLKSEFPNLRLITRKNERGYGSAHAAGFKMSLESGADIIVSLDADFSHDPKVIPELIKALGAGYDVAIGSRRISGGEIIGWKLWRKFCSAGAMVFSKIVLGIKTKDLTSGFRAYRRQVLESIDFSTIKSNGYSFLEELIYLIEKKGFKIKELPIKFLDRQQGQSKLSKKEIFKFFITLIKIKISSWNK